MIIFDPEFKILIFMEQIPLTRLQVDIMQAFKVIFSKRESKTPNE